jgi:hypothetical protein
VGSRSAADIPQVCKDELKGASDAKAGAICTINKVVEVYDRVVFVLRTTELNLFNQHALAGERIPAHLAQKWKEALTHLIAITDARSNGLAPASLAFLPTKELDKEKRDRFRRLVFPEPNYEYDASLAMALSIVLIDAEVAGASKASAQSCNLARIYIDHGTTKITEIEKNKEKRPYEWQPLRRQASLVADRISDSCD